MNKRLLYIIIVLICISLLGIIAVQFFWIRNAIQVREAQFDRSVNDAMGIAVNKLEARDNLYFIDKNYAVDSIRAVIQAFAKDTLMNWEPKLDSLLALEENAPPPPPPTLYSTFSKIPPASHPRLYRQDFSYYIDFDKQKRYIDSLFRSQDHFIILPDQAFSNINFEWDEEDIKQMDSLFLQQEIVIENSNIRYQVHSFYPDKPEVIVHYSGKRSPQPQPSSLPRHRPSKTIRDQVKKLTKKAEKVQDVIKKMTIELESKPRPIQDRIDRKVLEKTLKKAFADKNIDQPFEFAVQSRTNDSVFLPIRSDGFKSGHEATKYRVSLFPNDIFQKQNFLLVHFAKPASQLLKSLSLLMIASILFTLIVVITSGLSIFVIIRQKKISDIKTDFINNMTHEFKTPIATISIAVDSINNSKVIEQPEMIRNYTRVIKEENNRMNTRVEQVLQMALLDSSEFKLNEKRMDINHMIQKVTENIRLQVENRNGNLCVSREADKTMIMADESHLTNVLMSLLDNAIKYSPGPPEIRVSTQNRGSNVVIIVEDKGIGMSSETQRKIFDKFYRVTSGNIHNVKGFGLGLSYAKAILLAHKGEIVVKSEPGKGSRFEIILPVSPEEIIT